MYSKYRISLAPILNNLTNKFFFAMGELVIFYFMHEGIMVDTGGSQQ